MLALVICDSIIVESGTNKHSLIGTFNTIAVRQFPALHPSMSIYVALTDGHGQYQAVLRLVELESGREVFSLPGSLELRDPLLVAECAFRIGPVRFEREGQYAVEFVAAGQMLGSRKLRVQKLNPSQPQA
jgi:hypothetical protein